MIFWGWEILVSEGGGNMERFGCETQVVSGEKGMDALAAWPCRRLLVITRPEWHRERMTDRIIAAAGNPVTEVWEVYEGTPTMKQAVEGSRKIREVKPDLVVALGEMDVLDLGKAMVCFSKHSCRLAVISMAFGTGTEVTDRVLLFHNGGFHLLRDKRMRPDLAILDGAPLETMTKETIAEQGFELLTAAVECHCGVREGLLSDLHAREAFASCWAALPAAVSGSVHARRRLQTASVLVGLAVDQTGLGLCRALENSLGMSLGLSRGKAASIVLPAVIGCNGHAAGRKYAELCRAAGLGGSREDIGIRNLKSGLIRLRRELGLPGTLVQAGVDLRTVWNSSSRIVSMTLEDPECRNNPVTVDDFLVRRILDEITGRI